MKNLILISFLFASMSILNAQIQVNSSGFVGLGTNASTSYNLTASGSNYFTGYMSIGAEPNASYKLKVSGDSYFSGNLGLGTTPSSSYKCKVTGSSLFTGITNFVGNCYLSGGNTTLAGDLNITGSSIGSPTLYVTSNSYHTPGAMIVGTSNFAGPYMLYVGGDAYSTGSWLGSDKQLKKNVSVLDGILMLSKIMNLDGKKFEFKSKEELDALITNKNKTEIEYSRIITNLPIGVRYGFIAQEIEKEFPELVKTDSITNLKAVDYDGMIPILLQAIKEQQNQINTLNKTVATLQGISETKPLSIASPSLVTSINSQAKTEVPFLEQNAPNPFNVQTQIGYYLPSKVNDAQLSIYNLSGRQLRCIKLTERGRGNITIMANDLESGIYLYSLIVDGTEVSCKRMILTD